MKTVLIAIQARSTSTRLPNKVNMQIGGRPMLQWVVDSCQIAARFLRSEQRKLDCAVSVCLVIPKGDPIKQLFQQSQIPIVEGDEHDVLSRYAQAAKLFNADYVVRITADCLFIPPHHISRHVKAAVMKERDYTSCTHYRTYKEGWDCEVLSRRLVDWLDENASTDSDREHVTTLIGPGKPFPFRHEDGKPSICHVLNFYCEDDIKTSIDTKEEYEAAERLFQRYQRMRNEAKKNGTFLA